MSDSIWIEHTKNTVTWTEHTGTRTTWSNTSDTDTTWSTEGDRGWFATGWFEGWFGEDRSI